MIPHILIPVTSEAEVGESWLRLARKKCETLSEKQNRAKKSGGVWEELGAWLK
jgi:hypothetical protein